MVLLVTAGQLHEQTKEAYRKRNIVERLINRLKQFRHIATRYEKRVVNCPAMLTVPATVIWL